MLNIYQKLRCTKQFYQFGKAENLTGGRREVCYQVQLRGFAE